MMPDGKLVDDFLIIKGRNSVHVCNAPSPAATASLEIGRAVADHVPDVRPHTTVAVTWDSAVFRVSGGGGGLSSTHCY